MSICSTGLSRHERSTNGLKPITVTVAEAKHLSGLGETKLRELIGTGTLQTVRVGRRRLVVFESLRRLPTPAACEPPQRRARPRKRDLNEGAGA
jgi:hypothetical protein